MSKTAREIGERFLKNCGPTWAANRARGQVLRDAITAILAKEPGLKAKDVRFRLQMREKPTPRYIARVMLKLKRKSTHRQEVPAKVIPSHSVAAILKRVPVAKPAPIDPLAGYKDPVRPEDREVWEPDQV